MSPGTVAAPLLAALMLTLGALFAIPICAEVPPESGEVRSGDSVVREASTFLGGEFDETIIDGAIDDSGSIYIVGTFRGLINPYYNFKCYRQKYKCR